MNTFLLRRPKPCWVWGRSARPSTRPSFDKLRMNGLTLNGPTPFPISRSSGDDRRGLVYADEIGLRGLVGSSSERRADVTQRRRGVDAATDSEVRRCIRVTEEASLELLRAVAEPPDAHDCARRAHQRRDVGDGGPDRAGHDYLVAASQQLQRVRRRGACD